MTEALLPAVEILTGPAPTHAVIWMHGLGADGHDFEPVVDEFDAEDEIGDVQPMEPDEIIEAVRNNEAREVLAAANETMAAQLKEETDKLLDSVLYTTSMNMKNGFHMSDF